MVAATGGFTGPVETIQQGDTTLADTGAQPEGVVLDVGHRFRTAGDHDAGRAGGDLPRGVQHRLQARAAAAVDLQTGHPGAEAGVQRRDPTDGGRFAVGVAVAEDDVVDVALPQAGAGDERA